MAGSTVGAVQNSTAAATGEATSYSSVFTNYPLLSALVAFFIAQSSKLASSWYKEHKWDFKELVGSGGMPSSHSATVTALAVAIGLKDGFGGSLFSIATIFALVVMYDASGVRLHAGRQAEVLNQIVCELPSEHPLAESRPLRELLGHTPPQVVAGAILGLFTAVMINFIRGFGWVPTPPYSTKYCSKSSSSNPLSTKAAPKCTSRSNSWIKSTMLKNLYLSFIWMFPNSSILFKFFMSLQDSNSVDKRGSAACVLGYFILAVPVCFLLPLLIC